MDIIWRVYDRNRSGADLVEFTDPVKAKRFMMDRAATTGGDFVMRWGFKDLSPDAIVAELRG